MELRDLLSPLRSLAMLPRRLGGPSPLRRAAPVVLLGSGAKAYSASAFRHFDVSCFQKDTAVPLQLARCCFPTCACLYFAPDILHHAHAQAEASAEDYPSAGFFGGPDQVISASAASASSAAETVPDEVVSTSSNFSSHVKSEKLDSTAREPVRGKKRKRKADDGIDEDVIAGTPETGIGGGEGGGRATAKAHPNHPQTDGKVPKNVPKTTHGGQRESDQKKETARATTQQGLSPLPVRFGRMHKVICIARPRGPVVIPPAPTANMPPLFILKSNDSAAYNPPAAFPFPCPFSLPPPPPPPPSLIEKFKSTNNNKS